MKVLLLSCSTGGGHDSAAKAIKEKFKEYDIDCVMIDSIYLTSKSFSNKVNKLYIDLVNNKPNLWKKIYKIGEWYGNLKIKSPVYGVNMLFAKNLSEFIIKNNFDVVITTHLYPTETLTSMKKKNPNIKFIAVATDYVKIPFWEETNPDYFVIPSKDLKKDFTRKGIDSKKLLPFGIPVSAKFEYKFNKKEARTILSLPQNKKTILVMTGSMGYGNVDKMLNRIIEKYASKVNVVVICGNNKELKERLEKNYPQSNIIIKGFTEEVYIYMDACDVILTKPGGLTSTETAIKNIPTIFTNPIPGCEDYNAKFFEERNMALCANNEDEIIKKLDIILTDKKLVLKMKNAQSKYINKNSTKDIVEFVIKKYGK